MKPSYAELCEKYHQEKTKPSQLKIDSSQLTEDERKAIEDFLQFYECKIHQVIGRVLENPSPETKEKEFNILWNQTPIMSLKTIEWFTGEIKQIPPKRLYR